MTKQLPQSAQSQRKMNFSVSLKKARKGAVSAATFVSVRPQQQVGPSLFFLGVLFYRFIQKITPANASLKRTKSFMYSVPSRRRTARNNSVRANSSSPVIPASKNGCDFLCIYLYIIQSMMKLCLKFQRKAKCTQDGF